MGVRCAHQNLLGVRLVHVAGSIDRGRHPEVLVGVEGQGQHGGHDEKDVEGRPQLEGE